MRHLRHLIVATTVLVMPATILTGATAGFGSAARDATAPPPRYSMALSEDVNGHAVMFGGIGSDAVYLADTWTWDGATWVEEHPVTSPSARCCMGTAFDAARHRVVMFGGIDTHGVNLDETWTWDGTTWTQQHPAQSPPGRGYMGLAYDAARGQVVLFAGGGSGLDDTWTWDGTTWTEQHPSTSPPFRSFLSLAYDAFAKQVVLFGGRQGIEDIRYLRDTWTWDGTTWTKQHPALSPSGRASLGLAAFPARHQIVQFGGVNFTGPLRGTGTWDGTNWIDQAPPLAPSPRDSPGMAYDRASGRVLLFGGYGRLPEGFFGPLGDTWTWDGRGWSMQSPGSQSGS